VRLLTSEDVTSFFNSEEVRAVEIPSANSHASARALALLAGVMANRGKWGDNQVLRWIPG
jgi:hypothetical protein